MLMVSRIARPWCLRPDIKTGRRRDLRISPFPPCPMRLLTTHQSILASFFKEVLANNVGDFQNLYNMLKPEEQHQLSLVR